MALENCPTDARGLMSGILQQGYSFGYVCAACANLGVGGGVNTWKTVFWIAAGLSIGVGLIRICFPESRQFIEAKELGKNGGKAAPSALWKETKIMLAQQWKLCVYCIILMTWFNCECVSLGIYRNLLTTSTDYSHTSQDSYTTFMLTEKELDNAGASRASILMKVGACVGGTIIGYISQFAGRRRTIIVSALISGCLIPGWILPHGERSLSASGFFMQFFVQGAWGVIPIHLNELSPTQFRSSFPGLTYQLGNMISSPSAQIVNAVAEKTFITAPSGDRVEAYGPVMGVATAIIALGIAATTAVGPEKRGRSFEAPPLGTTLMAPKDIEEGEDYDMKKEKTEERTGVTGKN